MTLDLFHDKIFTKEYAGLVNRSRSRLHHVHPELHYLVFQGGSSVVVFLMSVSVLSSHMCIQTIFISA